MNNYTRKTEKCLPTKNHPELMDLLIDLALLTQKYHVKKIASTVGITKQSLQQKVNQRKENRE